MGLNDFTIKNNVRALPVFILADTSGSMDGEKIQALNNALREMVTSLKSVEDIRGEFKVGIITFGGDVILHQELENVEHISLTELRARGNTPMGAAISLVTKLINDKSVVPSTAYTPTIVLVSDGMPTDIRIEDATFDDYINWEPIVELQKAETRASKCLRLAMGIGADADNNMLRAFVNNSVIPVFKSKDAAGIQSFFKWVTMSTVSRMTSANPNNTDSILPDDLIEEDLPL